MKICPECNGEKGYELTQSYCWESPQITEWVVCRVCKGDGKISDLGLAIYKARGGPAPPNLVRFKNYVID